MIELLVAILLFAVASAIILNMFVNATKAVSQSSALSQNTQAASNMMNELSRVVRSGSGNPKSGGAVDPAIVAGSRESLTIISLVDSGVATTIPNEVAFSLDSTRGLVEKRWKAVPAASGFYTFTGSALASTRTFSGPLIAPVGANPTYLFTYLDANGVVLSMPSGSLLPTQLASVHAVMITVVVNASGDPSAAPVTIQNTVNLPNVP